MNKQCKTIKFDAYKNAEQKRENSARIVKTMWYSIRAFNAYS
jgi:hypothetical protein